MQRLSGLDAAFLALESPSAHMQVLGVAILDPSTAAPGFGFETVRTHVESRLPLIPPFRQRLLTVPFGLHYPLWVEDPDFDLDYHFRRVALPAPGGQRELAAFAADVAGRALDRTRPLWEMYFVEGLEGGRVAVISKVHHACIDGVSGVDIMAHLFDFEADAPPREIVDTGDWHPDHVPNDAELLAHAMVSIARQPVRVIRTAQKIVTTALRVAQRVRGVEMKAGVPLTAPKLMMNGTITPHRKIAFSSVPLGEAKRVKDALGVKLNDVLLAVATGALRSYLDARGELPDRSLVATIPTSVRTEEQRNAMGNRVSAMFASLPVEIPDPLERVHSIHESMIDAKDMHGEIGDETLQDLAELASPAMLSSVMRMVSALRLTDRLGTAVHNLVVSNVPGPPFPLYMAGARLEAMHPLGPIFDGAALNLTVISYLDSIDFGFLACRELIPDLDDLAAAVPDALAELSKAVDSAAAEVRSRTRKTTPALAHLTEPDRDDDAAAAITPVVRPTPRPRVKPRPASAGLSRVAPRSVP